MRLAGRISPVAAVTEARREQMFELMERNYLGVRRETFDADLAEKRWVIELVNPEDGRVLGFSTQMIVEAAVGERRIKALFSGDTIIDPVHWGNNNLIQMWGRLTLALMEANDAELPPSELYWFLVTKGYKTYRFLPVFFREFYPRRGTPTPSCVGAALRALATRKYSERYDPKRGILLTDGEDSCRLREGIAPLTPERLADPDVRFFAEMNPGHARGEELCCLAPLTRANYTRAAYRAIGADPDLSLALSLVTACR